MQAFEYNGLWWLPGQENRQISGILKFHPTSGIRLELIGTFKKCEGQIDVTVCEDVKLILGLVSGKIVTLHKCYEYKFNLDSPGFNSSSYIVEHIIFNEHFKKEEDILFDGIRLGTTFLEEWTNIMVVKGSIFFDNEHNRQLNLHYRPLREPFFETEDFSVRFKFDLNFPFQVTKKFVLEQNNYLELMFKKPLTIEKMKEKIISIQNFLNLATQRMVHPVSIMGRTSHEVLVNNKNLTGNNVNIIYSLATKRFDREKPFSYEDILFSFEDIIDNFGIYLYNWIEKTSDNLKPVCDLYFAVSQVPMYPYYQFLSLVQAIEAYHRRTRDYEIIPKKDIKKIIKMIFKNFPGEEIEERFSINPDEFKKICDQKLGFAYEPSLKDRLMHLWKDYRFALELMFSEEEYERFAVEVVRTRGYYSHFPKDKEKRAKDFKELRVFICLLLFIIEISFLIEIGMKEEKIREIIRRNEEYKSLKMKTQKIFGNVV